MTPDEQAALYAAWSQQRSLARRRAREEARSDRMVCGLVAVLMLAWFVAVHAWEPFIK